MSEALIFVLSCTGGALFMTFLVRLLFVAPYMLWKEQAEVIKRLEEELEQLKSGETQKMGGELGG